MAKGATQEFIFQPATGYKVADVKIDNVSIDIPANNKYTFANVTANRTIYVAFEKIVGDFFTITPSAGLM